MLDGFYFTLLSRSTGRSAQTYERWSSFSISSGFGHFPQVFGQVVVDAYPILILFYYRGWQREVFKLIKSNFLVFLAV